MTSAVDHIERIESVLYRMRSQPTSARAPEPPRVGLSPASPPRRPAAMQQSSADGLDGDFSDGH